MGARRRRVYTEDGQRGGEKERLRSVGCRCPRRAAGETAVSWPSTWDAPGRVQLSVRGTRLLTQTPIRDLARALFGNLADRGQTCTGFRP